MTDTGSSRTVRDVVCPFCGLGCDDLTVAAQGRSLTVRENVCPIGETAFAAHPEEGVPRAGGQETSLDHALARAAEVLRPARRPLVAGLGSDAAGIRSALRLADRIGAGVDHLHGAAGMRNAAVVQTSGWITTTLAEARNRADLWILAGSDVGRRYPRFLERIAWPGEALFEPPPSQRRVVFIGPEASAANLPADDRIERIPCAQDRIGEVFAALRALEAGLPLFEAEPGGVPAQRLRALAERLPQAGYGVIAWDAGELDFPGGDLAVEAITGLIDQLNAETRWAGLPLGGRDGATTFGQACTWQTGFPGRVDLGPGYPRHAPHQLEAGRFAAEEADAVLWISAFDAGRLPPDTQAPTVVLGRSGLAPEREPSAYIPVGIPGLDHGGQAYRLDGVMALPLAQLRESGLPSTAQAIAGIEQRL